MQRNKSARGGPAASRLPAARRTTAQRTATPATLATAARARRSDAAIFSATGLGEAPPSYSAASPVSPGTPATPAAAAAAQPSGPVARRATMSQQRQRQSVEDPLAALSRFKVVYLLDDSPSMDSLWDELREALMGVVKAAVKYQRGGVDIHWMNDVDASLLNCSSASDIERMFSQVLPSGSTPTNVRLDDLMRPYIEDCEDAKAKRTKLPKPVIFVVITDGRPDDTVGVTDTIVEMASRLDEGRFAKHQAGVTFLQIGADEEASEFLRSLDDDLEEKYSVRDIVDCRQYEGSLDATFLLRALLGSVNKQIDAE